MGALLGYIMSWPTLVLALLGFGFLPGALMRIVVLAFRSDDPRRRELLAELHMVPRIERPFWVLEQLEVALLEGLGGRFRSRAIEMSRARNARSEDNGRPGFTQADFAAAVAASGGRVKMVLDDLPPDQMRLALAPGDDTPGLDYMLMVDGEGHFLGLGEPERGADGSIKPVVHDGGTYFMGMVDFADPNDPARPAFEEFIQQYLSKKKTV